MQPYGFIYRTTNNVNGMKYIGRRQGDPEAVRRYLGSGKVLKYALKKYGRQNFTRETLEVCFSKEEYLQAERKWLKQLNVVESNEYYNLTDFSYGAEPGQFHTEETKAKMRRPKSEEVKAKLRGPRPHTTGPRPDRAGENSPDQIRKKEWDLLQERDPMLYSELQKTMNRKSRIPVEFRPTL
ncbi:homing endonuclease [Sinorhizobium phage phiM9]|uniref:Putative GIY-YIG family homing endonuclease n=1 Tax=Sinorhizobium phage phiM9 TaxID=1636182 RepID=A0A0F6R7T5_9CAUD|nr:homing endonuclease [Sinorhizobium phage phiM9]AKE44898.1 putative GIY-YIG family homing endonuclease [Sinorhizobium phage phiM9]